MLQILNYILLHLLPHHRLTGVMRWLTQTRNPFFTRHAIKLFVRQFKVDMDEAMHPEISSYQSFDDFFTRALKPGSRPLPEDPKAVISPVDGTVSQCGSIRHDQLIQAKGIDYSLDALFAGDHELADQFIDGTFATLYLSPRDYHRIHMPVTGTLEGMRYIPGRLFSVNPYSVDHLQGLFTRNERLVTIFNGERGPFAVILVGAIFVSGIETVWSGMVSQGRSGSTIRTWGDKEIPAVTLERGQEMGRFHMGSTAILCFPRGTTELHEGLETGQGIRLGQSIGRLL